jgi:hypothetical protein
VQEILAPKDENKAQLAAHWRADKQICAKARQIDQSSPSFSAVAQALH